MSVVITAEQMGMTSEAFAAQRAFAREIKAGDLLTVSDLWNRTERLLSRQIPIPAVVEIVRPTQGASQTNVMVTVSSRTGAPVTIDAGWFLETQRAGGL